MFLERISQLGLLEHDPETNILQHFPLSVRRVLVKEVTSFLLHQPNSASLLSSRSHVLWALEACGEGFRLPVEDEETITEVTELYKQWMMDPKKRPGPITKDFQFFFQIMMKHFSLLFGTRSEEVQRHAGLCSTVLNIMLLVCKALQSLSDETWDVVLKILIGIADSLFMSPRDPSLLGQKLCNQILKVLFEIWLTAKTKKPEMWGFFKDRISKWTHISQTVIQWQQVSLALSMRLVRLMYGPAHGSDAVVIRVDNEQTTLNLPSDYVFYSWHRILTILDDLNQIASPSNHLMAFQGVEFCVKEFLDVKRDLPESIVPPDGNTILHIFGKWLFEAIQIHRPGYEEGTALAIKIVSKIFKDRKDTIFLDTYRASYYRALQEVLMLDGRPLMSAIIHSKELLSRSMNGSRILVQYYVYAVTRIIVGNVSVSRPDSVRAACLYILRTIFCFPKYFNQALFKIKVTYKERQSAVSNYQTGKLVSGQTPPPKSVFECQNYAELLPHIDFVLLEGLRNETSTQNILSFLQMCFAHSTMYLDLSSEFAKQVVDTILKNIVPQPRSTGWNRGVMYIALKTLAKMSRFFHYFEKPAEIGLKVVKTLCAFAITTCRDLYKIREGKVDKQKVRLTVQAFTTITDWVIVDQWVVSYPEIIGQILDATSVGIYGPKPKQDQVVTGESKKKRKKEEKKKEEEQQPITPSSKVAKAAQYFLRTFVNRLGVFPSPGAGAASLSSLVTEEELLADNVAKAERAGFPPPDRKQFIRNFILQGNTLLTLVDQPYEDGGPMTTLILRDGSGRYCWQFISAFLPFHERGIETKTMEHCRVPVAKTVTPHQPQTIPIEEERLASIKKYLAGKKLSLDVIGLAHDMAKRERDYLEKTDFDLGADIVVHPPEVSDPYVSNCKFQQGRMLLTHLGFMAFENWGNMSPLDQTTHFYSQIKILDQAPERDSFGVSIVYQPRNRSLSESLSHTSGSLDYQEFVSSLGWGVHIPTHTGHLGGLERSPPTHGVFSPYYSDFSMEVIFHVATLMPNNAQQQSEQAHKLRLIGSNSVLIVWTETPFEEYSPEFGKSNMIQIAIHPLFKKRTYNLYRIKIFAKKALNTSFWDGLENLDLICPTVDDMIVCKSGMGDLVRELAIEARYLLGETIQGKECFKHFEPFNTRERIISDIGKKFRIVEPFEVFHANLFQALPSKHVVPLKSSIPSRAERAQQKEIEYKRREEEERRAGGMVVGGVPPPLPATSASDRRKILMGQRADLHLSVPAVQGLPPPISSPVGGVPTSALRNRTTSEIEKDLPPPLPSLSLEEGIPVGGVAEKRKKKKSRKKEEEDGGDEGEEKEEREKKGERRDRSKSPSKSPSKPGRERGERGERERGERGDKDGGEQTWATAEERKRPTPPSREIASLAPPLKESTKFAMTSHRMASQDQGGKEEEGLQAKPPRPPPPKGTLPHLEDLDSYNF